MTVQVDIDRGSLLRGPLLLLPYALDVAGRARVARIRRDLAVPYPPASLPFNPPHRRRGRLQASVGYEVVQEPDAVVLRVGATAPYAASLQYGTRSMMPRPFLDQSTVKVREVVSGVVGWMRNATAAVGGRARS